MAKGPAPVPSISDVPIPRGRILDGIEAGLSGAAVETVVAEIVHRQARQGIDADLFSVGCSEQDVDWRVDTKDDGYTARRLGGSGVRCQAAKDI